MGGEYLMYKYYKINLADYNNLQSEINNALYDKYIANKRGSCVIYPTPQIINNNNVYFSLVDFIYSDPLIENSINKLIEITEEEFYQNIL